MIEFIGTGMTGRLQVTYIVSSGTFNQRCSVGPEHLSLQTVLRRFIESGLWTVVTAEKQL